MQTLPAFDTFVSKFGRNLQVIKKGFVVIKHCYRQCAMRGVEGKLCVVSQNIHLAAAAF